MEGFESQMLNHLNHNQLCPHNNHSRNNHSINEINVEVELVTFLERGDGNDFSNVERVDKVANLVKKLSEKVKIKALHFDQECSENFNLY